MSIRIKKKEEDKTIHYFINDESNTEFHKINLISYLDIPQMYGKSRFKQIEKIHLFMSTNISENEIVNFEIEFGRDDIFYSGSNDLSELKESQESKRAVYMFKSVTAKEYILLRKRVFKIYLAHPYLPAFTGSLIDGISIGENV